MNSDFKFQVLNMNNVNMNMFYSSCVMTCFNNDTTRIKIHGWRYDTRKIWAHLERNNVIRFNDQKSM